MDATNRDPHRTVARHAASRITPHPSPLEPRTIELLFHGPDRPPLAGSTPQ